MATKEQIERIKYLRGNGLSQKEIADDVSLSPQMISVVLKKLASEFQESKPVKLINAVGFEPKDTVIEFTTKDFENYRESDTLYSTSSSVFEMRPGIVHKTTFPEVVPIDTYPALADLLPIYNLPTKLFQSKNLKSQFISKLESKARDGYLKSSNIISFILRYVFPRFSVDLTKINQGSKEFLNDFAEIMTSEFGLQLANVQENYLQDMPDDKEIVGSIRYQIINEFTSKALENSQNEAFSELEQDYLLSKQPEYEYLIGTFLGWGEEENHELIIESMVDRFLKTMEIALSKKNLAVEDLRYIIEHSTLDRLVIDKYISTGAKSEKQLIEIEERGVSNIEELEIAKTAFNNQPIVLADYPSLQDESNRLNQKIKSAVERGDIDDCLIHAFTLFELNAVRLWNHPKVALTDIAKLSWNSRQETEAVSKIYLSNMKNNTHILEILNSSEYTPSKEELQICKEIIDPRTNHRHPLTRVLKFPLKKNDDKEVFCRNLLRSKFSYFTPRNGVTSSEVLINLLAPVLSDDGELHRFSDQARHLRNQLVHSGNLGEHFVPRHVRAILELSELVLSEIYRIESS